MSPLRRVWPLEYYRIGPRLSKGGGLHLSPHAQLSARSGEAGTMSRAQKGKIGIPWVRYEEAKWKLIKLNVQYSGGCGGNEVGHLLLQRVGGFSMMYAPSLPANVSVSAAWTGACWCEQGCNLSSLDQKSTRASAGTIRQAGQADNPSRLDGSLTADQN